MDKDISLWHDKYLFHSEELDKMKNLFEASTIAESQDRIQTIQENTSPLWGQMNTAQMLAHCSKVLENALGESYYTIPFSVKVLTILAKPYIRKVYVNDQPFKPMKIIKNKYSLLRKLQETNPFIISHQPVFQEERTILLGWLDTFFQKGRQKTRDAIHPHWGRFTPEQWAIGQYKHLDHHLRQFGV